MSPHEEYMERAKALRHNPMVQAWIDAYPHKSASDCRYCSFPHNEHSLCAGGTFGQFSLGGDIYHVHIGDVVYFVEFMRTRAPHGSHHWRKDVFFSNRPDTIEVTYYTSYNNAPQKHVWKIPRCEWETIVSQMALPSTR